MLVIRRCLSYKQSPVEVVSNILSTSIVDCFSFKSLGSGKKYVFIST